MTESRIISRDEAAEIGFREGLRSCLNKQPAGEALIHVYSLEDRPDMRPFVGAIREAAWLVIVPWIDGHDDRGSPLRWAVVVSKNGGRILFSGAAPWTDGQSGDG